MPGHNVGRTIIHTITRQNECSECTEFAPVHCCNIVMANGQEMPCSTNNFLSADDPAPSVPSAATRAAWMSAAHLSILACKSTTTAIKVIIFAWLGQQSD